MVEGAATLLADDSDPASIAFFVKIDYGMVAFPLKYHDSNGNFKRKGREKTGLALFTQKELREPADWTLGEKEKAG